MIGEFKLSNLRNYDRARFDFSGRKQLLVGPNGAGKSNLLEALAFLGVLRSFRTTRIGEMIRTGADGFAIGGAWQAGGGYVERLETRWQSDGRRQLFVNGNAVASGRDFIQYYHPVVFAPEDLELITGMPGARRRFFDMLCSQLDPGYLNVLHDYFHALKQRNAALRQRRAVPEVMEAYESLLAFAGADLTARRQVWLAEFNRELAALSETEGRIEVDYRPQCAGSAEDYLALFDRMRSREIERHSSLCGCHLDDFRVRRDEQPMRGFASNGQNRMAALLFKLASAALLARHCGERNLLILVDDVTGDLDRARRSAFWARIAGAEQMFFTFTARPEDEFFADAQITALGS
ncbi:DNA replication and repair protein RecF [bioreactor metagenome]|uniref:DNA replication and repair protein RecF n=1 Tax=bioreactor metagenome TaxID=1076179 RepID=A0A645AXX6_9ZZZZ